MEKPQIHRVTRELTPEEQERLVRNRELVAAELPELIARVHLMQAARKEPTISGALRQAVHSGPYSVPKLAELIGITSVELSQFLTGVKPLMSDVIDRLAKVLGYELHCMSGG